MAEKKYVDLSGLTHYDEKLKALIDEKDAATLAAAKQAAEDLGSNYDAAGTAATAVKALENGQVKANKEAIDKLNGSTSTAGSVAKAVADVKAELETEIAAADGKAAAAQAKADSVSAYVGTIPEGASAKDVVSYVNEKTADIASGSEFGSLKTRVATVEGKITTAEGNITSLDGRMDAVEAKATANASAITTLNGTGAGSVKKQIDDAFNDFATKVSDDGVVNTYKELIDYCASHSADAAEMAGNISSNAAAIAKLEKFVGTLPKDTSAATVIDYINAKVAAEQSRAEKVEGALDTRVKAVEAKFGEGEGSVAEQIATAKQEAIDAAASDATTKAGTAKTEAISAAKSYTDTEVGKVKSTADANASDISGLKTRMTTAEGDIDDLQAAIGTDGSVTKAIAEAKSAGTTAQTTANKNKTDIATLNTTVSGHTSSISSHGDRLTALEGKVGDGMTPITNDEINALFNQE